MHQSGDAPEGRAGPDADFKASFFDRYRSTHVDHRKQASLETFRRRLRVWDRLFGGFLPADRSAEVLDAGCGEGMLLWWLHRRGYTRARGIEISGEQVALAQELGVPGVKQGDLTEVLGREPEFFDLVIFRNVLEHFPRPQIVEILEKTRSSLRPGGRVVFQVPNAESPFFGRIRYGDFTHEIAFTRSSVRQVLGMTGFEHIEVRPVPPVPETLRGTLRLPLWKLAEFLYSLLLYAEVGRDRGVVTMDLIAAAQKPETA